MQDDQFEILLCININIWHYYDIRDYLIYFEITFNDIYENDLMFRFSQCLFCCINLLYYRYYCYNMEKDYMLLNMVLWMWLMLYFGWNIYMNRKKKCLILMHVQFQYIHVIQLTCICYKAFFMICIICIYTYSKCF